MDASYFWAVISKYSLGTVGGKLRDLIRRNAIGLFGDAEPDDCLWYLSAAAIVTDGTDDATCLYSTYVATSAP